MLKKNVQFSQWNLKLSFHVQKEWKETRNPVFILVWSVKQMRGKWKQSALPPASHIFSPHPWKQNISVLAEIGFPSSLCFETRGAAQLFSANFFQTQGKMMLNVSVNKLILLHLSLSEEKKHTTRTFLNFNKKCKTFLTGLDNVFLKICW